MDAELDRLTRYDQRIQEIARDFGLDFFPQEFDVIPAQKMLEIMAYRFPVNFSHWSFGRDYEREKTRYEHGFGIPYEVVLNSNPARAYLMNTNPPAVQAMVMAHVYAHNDFMKNNFHFKPTRRDILPSASESALRFQRYEKRYGMEEVERTLDAALSVELNVNPDFFIREENEEEQRERLSSLPATAEVRGRYDDLLGHHEGHRRTEKDYSSRTPLEPERDLLLYLMNHSPKPLREWEKDILSVVRDQSRYFMPQRRTKIMNEGWATYWHMRIMERLFREAVLSEEDHGYYNLYNARVLAPHPRTINPYAIGLKIFEEIERRWDRGQFGGAWEECGEPAKRETWDQGLGQGREKILEVRRRYSDRFFIEEFLTEEMVNELRLYVYEGRREGEEIQYVVKEKEWRRIKGLLVSYLSTFDTPLIFVEDGDYHGKRELYMRHAYEGIELDQEYREKTMEQIFHLWARPVHLESVVGGEKMVFTFDGTTHG
jgi:stage V sporulation protein R